MGKSVRFIYSSFSFYFFTILPSLMILPTAAKVNKFCGGGDTDSSTSVRRNRRTGRRKGGEEGRKKKKG